MRKGSPHIWGMWIRADGKKFRYCINGFCPMAQTDRKKIFVARKDRTEVCR
mgnify:CR=1 FL=1